VSYLYDVVRIRWIGRDGWRCPARRSTDAVRVHGNQIVLEFDKTGTGDLVAQIFRHRYLWNPQTGGPPAWPTKPARLHDGGGELRLTLPGNVVCRWWTNAGRSATWPSTIPQRTARRSPIIACTTRSGCSKARPFRGGLPVRLHRPPVRPAGGEQYNTERWYEAVTGRWLSEDPAGLAVDATSTVCGNRSHDVERPDGLIAALGPQNFSGRRSWRSVWALGATWRCDAANLREGWGFAFSGVVGNAWAAATWATP